MVSLPYGFTLFSNSTVNTDGLYWFHYLMDLHYSQTGANIIKSGDAFHYLMDLHYSQTSNKLRPLYSAGQIHKI